MIREYLVDDTQLGCNGDYSMFREIVRCKDCTWFDGWGFCEKHSLCGLMIDKNFFCADGERDDEEVKSR